MYWDQEGNCWLKGNLHTHTTCSDGHRTPEEVLTMYRDAGYDFIALTDHWVLSDTVDKEDFLQLAGCEFDMGTNAQEGVFHVVAIGMEETPNLTKGGGLALQNVVDEIRRCGGIAILAHPAWSLNRPGDVLPITGLSGVEIYNTVSGRPWNGRPYSGDFIDALGVAGKYLPCMAADDAHFYEGEQMVSYLMLKAKSPSKEDVMAALRAGDFYATQGPCFSVKWEGDRLIVESTPVEEVVFLSDQLWVPDRVWSGHDITRAEYQIKTTEHFVRVELYDKEGRAAWSSPIVVG